MIRNSKTRLNLYALTLSSDFLGFLRPFQQ